MVRRVDLLRITVPAHITDLGNIALKETVTNPTRHIRMKHGIQYDLALLPAVFLEGKENQNVERLPVGQCCLMHSLLSHVLAFPNHSYFGL